MKKFSLSRLGPDEAEMGNLEGVTCVECIIRTESANVQKKLRQIKHNWKNIEIKKAHNPFAQGGQRISYHGKMLEGNRYRQQEQYIVLKEFKHHELGRDRREEYMQIMETQFTAGVLADEFNKIAPSGSKKLCFLPVSKTLRILLSSTLIFPD